MTSGLPLIDDSLVGAVRIKNVANEFLGGITALAFLACNRLDFVLTGPRMP